LKQLAVFEKTTFFRFYDQEIAAAFDPPLLLKCTLNIFLKHDVTKVRFEDVNDILVLLSGKRY
jgi:hypothetical protein